MALSNGHCPSVQLRCSWSKVFLVKTRGGYDALCTSVLFKKISIIDVLMPHDKTSILVSVENNYSFFDFTGSFHHAGQPRGLY